MHSCDRRLPAVKTGAARHHQRRKLVAACALLHVTRPHPKTLNDALSNHMNRTRSWMHHQNCERENSLSEHHHLCKPQQGASVDSPAPFFSTSLNLEIRFLCYRFLVIPAE